MEEELEISYKPIKSNIFLTAEKMILKNYKEKPYRSTPLVITFYENVLTNIDIQKLIEMGLQIIRFRMTQVTRNDKLKLLQMLRKAQEWVCEKYDVSTWPLAICTDIPNAAIRSGYLNKKMTSIKLNKGSLITVTSNTNFWDKCNNTLVFIDDPYTIQIIKPGAEITFCGGGIKMICVKVIDKKSIRCEVIRGGELGSNEFVTVRGIKYKKPPLSKIDLEIVQFAKDLQVDILTVFSVRFASTLQRLRKECGRDYEPLMLSTICDQEGLDNIDEIIEASDGIVLAREFMTHHIVNRNSLAAIQMQMCAKCKQAGKPFFISGNVLEQTLRDGSISTCDLADITNAVLQGAGFVLRHYSDAVNAIKAMDILDSVCKSVESSKVEDEFKIIIDEFMIPVNAAEACVLSCALMVRQSGSLVVILPTVTGRTAVQLSHMVPMSIIITISRNPVVARKMQMYRGIYAIIYDKKKKTDWFDEMEARVQFAVSYGVKKDILSYGNTYVILRKSSFTSPFCDSVSVWTVTLQETIKNRVSCPDNVTPKPVAKSNYEID